MDTSVAWGVAGFQLKSWVPGMPNTCPNRALAWPSPLPDGTCKSWPSPGH
jgi:hypothetical protein